MFVAIEKPYEDGQRNSITNLKYIMSNFETLRSLVNSSDNWNQSRDEFLILLDETRSLTLKIILSESNSMPWNVFTGFHFCITAITTIGKLYIPLHRLRYPGFKNSPECHPNVC